MTVLLTTQYLDEADRLADQVAVLDGGRIVARGTPDELKARLGGGVRVRLQYADRAGYRPRWTRWTRWSPTHSRCGWSC